MNNHRQRTTGFIQQTNPVKGKIPHVRPQYDGMYYSVVIHHALTADGLPVNNLFSRWQGFITVNRPIRLKPRYVSEHKFIQQDRLPRGTLLRFPLFKCPCNCCL
ncbi:Uncharacterised protein [Salmonella enterica subsp. enterica serovar Typhimurium str. DT104]|nr:Uncharacterised protein [Salmonella enterica subsp. enterica serovar Typhimurium str. DT104]CQQ83039.1 Uncharacterised protein [Salmonella enterica subsp. enterica serovar Typhimurium str. DT104]